MNLLLDTHVLLWWDAGASEMGATARAVIANPDNTVYVSAASIWEIAIKSAKGKLRFNGSAHAAIEANGFLPLSMSTTACSWHKPNRTDSSCCTPTPSSTNSAKSRNSGRDDRLSSRDYLGLMWIAALCGAPVRN
jgi:hypothetical protein